MGRNARLIDAVLLGGPAIVVLGAAVAGAMVGLARAAIVLAAARCKHWPRWNG